MFKLNHPAYSGRGIQFMLFSSWALVGSCSEGSNRLRPWPDLESPSFDPSSTTGQPGDRDVDDEEQPNDEHPEGEDDDGDDERLPDSDENNPDTNSSSGEGDSQGESSSSESTSESTSESSDETSSSDEGSSAPPECIQTLCYETNASQQARGYPTEHTQVIFRLFVKKGMKRLARVELVEGFSEEATTIVLKKNGSNKHGDLLAEISWSDRPDDHLSWVGSDFDVPISIEGERVIWVEVSPAGGEFFSVSFPGKTLPMWHRLSQASSWVRNPSPVMFRAYCCEE